ncbi:response regulator [Massilia sp. LXY-6]|uniref:response regulator n=1 Tax=Massilia sp. LXY-6 TaxID=3379823 RepID=UPI003EE2E327
MIRIVLADDHQLIREGIKKTLAPASDIVVVGEAWDMKSLLSVLSQDEVDLVVLDLTLSPLHELAALRIVRERFPHIPVLVISMHLESQFGVECLREGASGYISKSMTVDVIEKSVRKVHAGGHYVSESLADLLALELTAPKTPSPHALLTDRERQVFALLAMGLSVKQVAGKLDISNSSVNTYRTRIFAKMQLTSNAELIRYAIKHRIAS